VIRLGVDRLGPWWTGSFMDNPTFIAVRLSDVRVIMTIMHVLVVDLPGQAVMDGFKYSSACLPGARGCLQAGLVWSSIKWLCYPKTPTLWSLARYWESPGLATEGPGALGQFARRNRIGLAGGEFLPAHGHCGGKRTGTDHF
jgi:hypothetical protein